MNSRRTFILLAVLILGTTTLRLALGLHFYGFLTGDDVEILSAAFKNVYDLHYMPWNIRNLFISDFLVAPVLRLASAFRVTDTKTQLWIATFPFVCLSSINIFLTFVLANRWIKEKNAAILSAFLYSFHWLPLAFGSTVYPRTASTTCVLLAVILCSPSDSRSRLTLLLAGLLLSVAFAIRYSEAIFLAPLSIFVLCTAVDLPQKALQLGILLIGFIAGSFLTVGLEDRITWGGWFSSLQAFAIYTLVEKKASASIAQQPLYYYFYRFQKWLFPPLLPFLFLSKKHKTWIWPLIFLLLPLFMLSAIQHKEERYLQGVIPFVCILIGTGAAVMLRLGWRRITVILVTLALLESVSEMRFISRKSMSAVQAAMFVVRDPNVHSVALSQPWAYGENLYLGNRIKVIELSLPPLPSEIYGLTPDTKYIGVYERDVQMNRGVYDALRSMNFTMVASWRVSRSKPVLIFRRGE